MRRKNKTMKEKVLSGIKKMPDMFSPKDLMRYIGIEQYSPKRRALYKIMGELLIQGDIRKSDKILDDQRKSLYEKVD